MSKENNHLNQKDMFSEKFKYFTHLESVGISFKIGMTTHDKAG